MGALAVLSAGSLAFGMRTPVVASQSSQHVHIDCELSRLCPDVADPESVYGYYVGHDEPSAAFYSNTAGSGNRMQYNLTLPADPPASQPTSRSYQFELDPTFWLGMDLCDTKSYPEQVSTCTPDSDTNITSNLAQHPGTAFLELQFYPPGWVPWPTWAVAVGASGCDPTRWCAAMNVFSLLEDPVNGTVINPTCQAKVGVETFEFAFVTRSGVAQAPANPLASTLATFTPDPTKDLFMASGDHLAVSMHDTKNGVTASINDLTSGQSGSMTASPANGFAQFKYAPTGTTCSALPYAFHPMYSTSSTATRDIWAAHSYNVSFASEIGHFQLCNGETVPASPFGLDSKGAPVACPKGNTEGFGSDQQPTDRDDNFCFPASAAMRIAVQGCTDSNTGFDGISYQQLWPDGNTAHHPTPVQFSSPMSGSIYNHPYAQTDFETNLPSIEGRPCSVTTGNNCTLIPRTGTGKPAAFYPFFTTVGSGAACLWQFGNVTPDATNDFGRNAQYGSELFDTYLKFGGGGATETRVENFRGVISNPC